MNDFPRDVAVIGGGGHVGLPLALTFASHGLRTVIYDINPLVLAKIKAGTFPFKEEGGEELLADVLAGDCLEITDAPDLLRACRYLVLVIGTPIDEHLNPTFNGLFRALDVCLPHMRPGQILALRSTVYPGMTRHLQKYLRHKGLDTRVVFCPERVAQGFSLKEFTKLPQIIGSDDPGLFAEIKHLFGRFTPEFIEMNPTEAELCKLMTNAWRYIQFAIVNQFFMIANREDVDFDLILHGCRHNYPRMAGMPGPGFAAGPCLVKDTMQLAAFSQNNFALGHAALLINEGLPAHVVELVKKKMPLGDLTAGILGMAFKADNDDARDSLSFKLRKLLTIEAKSVLCTDPFVVMPGLVPLDQVLAEADVLFVATPHRAYRNLTFRPDQLVLDVWNCTQ